MFPGGSGDPGSGESVAAAGFYGRGDDEAGSVIRAVIFFGSLGMVIGLGGEIGAGWLGVSGRERLCVYLVPDLQSGAFST